MTRGALRNLRSVDLGFDPARVTVVGVSLDEHGYDHNRAMAYHREVLPALEASGSFETVSLSGLVPFGSSSLVRIIPPGGDSEKPLSTRIMQSMLFGVSRLEPIVYATSH